RVSFAYKMLQGDPELPLSFLNSNLLLKQTLERTGENYLNWMMAESFLYTMKPDSAIIYFNYAKSSFLHLYTVDIRQKFFAELGICYSDLNDIKLSIAYYEKSYDLCNYTANVPLNLSCVGNLSELYSKIGYYKKA